MRVAGALVLLGLASSGWACGLACFLGQLRIEVPGELCRGKDCLNNLQCSHLGIAGLHTSSAPGLFGLQVQNLTFSCSADWVLHLLLTEHGSVSFTLDMSVAFGLRFSGGTYPERVTASNTTSLFVFSDFHVKHVSLVCAGVLL